MSIVCVSLITRPAYRRRQYQKTIMQQEILGAPPGKDKTANFSIAVVGLTQFAIIAINFLLGVLFVRANTDFCGSVFETRIGE